MSQDIIRLLPDSVANKIAAGEVIQRPASVIKELVENSVDAGATDIRIYIKDSGRTLIQVVDNGKGMSETDARMAFERHATSKIAKADDLFTLATMGFRGEALPSICAVAQVELRTRPEGSDMGTKIEIHGSNVVSHERCLCDKGANMMVKNIFYNVPARRKFLKSDNVELGHIMREFERLALVNNDKHMTLDTGTKVIDLPAASLKQRIGDIWKNNLNLQLLPIDIDTSMVKITGYVSRPEFARKRNALQFMIVNGRNMRHPYFHRAIASGYDNLISADSQPCYFLKFEVDPATIDVNVHPTKNEIKFEYDNEIFRILAAAVKAALGKFSAVPSIDFDTDVQDVAPPAPGERIDAPRTDTDPNYNPFNTGAGGFNAGGNPFGGGDAPRRHNVGSQYRPTRVSGDWETLYKDFAAAATTGQQETQGTIEEFAEEKNVQPAMCVQYGLKYIVMPVRDGLMVIDQHRAHVRLLYDEYLSNTAEGAASQKVMFAEPLCLDPDSSLVLENIEDELTRIGFGLEPGDAEGEWKINAVPASIAGKDPAKMLSEMIASLVEEDSPEECTLQMQLMQRVALAMAKCSAIKGGKRLTTEEMENLAARLLALPDFNYTPTGAKIVNLIPDNQIRFR